MVNPKDNAMNAAIALGFIPVDVSPRARSKNAAYTALTKRLARIAEVIEAVENRCMAADGPTSDTRHEMTTRELREIYRLAKGTL